MVDITKDEFWEKDYIGKTKNSFIKRAMLKNKFLSISFLFFAICILVNTVLICSFFRILNTL